MRSFWSDRVATRVMIEWTGSLFCEDACCGFYAPVGFTIVRVASHSQSAKRTDVDDDKQAGVGLCLSGTV